jgi:hypothetical protein
MRTAGKYFILIMILLAIQSCKKENACDCLKRTGSVIQEIRELENFHTVHVSNHVNVVFTEDTIGPQQVKAEAGENLIALVKTEVVDGILYIRNNNRCNFTRRYDVPITVYIRMGRELQKITASGTGKISNNGTCTSPSLALEIKSSGDITMNVSGSSVYTYQHAEGDIELTGTAREVIIYSTGTGFTITDECASPYCWVYTRTIGKTTVYPLQELICEIDGSGNLYYRGQPAQITSTLHSTGQVLPLE